MKQIPIKLHILSPTHIGCDEYYEPINFVINEKTKLLHNFNPIDFIKSLNKNNKTEFARLCESKNAKAYILKIYNFIKQHFNNNIKITSVPVSDGLVQHYLNVLNKQEIDTEIAQFNILRTSYNKNSGKPYIPGSSLKGAIRTAYLNKLAVDKGIKNFSDECSKLEKFLLEGNFSNDPFSLLRVSDLLPENESNIKVYYAINIKKNAQNLAQARGPYQILETIGRESIFQGTIDIINDDRKNNIKNLIDKKSLINAIYNFYEKNLKNETDILKKLGIKPIGISPKYKDNIRKNMFFIRVGRHSGAEAMTIDGNRKIKIMQGKDKKSYNSAHSTTFWVSSEFSDINNNNLQPFGWCLLEF